jgi:hypothetical protein
MLWQKDWQTDIPDKNRLKRRIDPGSFLTILIKNDNVLRLWWFAVLKLTYGNYLVKD